MMAKELRISNESKRLLQTLSGQPCTLQRIGSDRSLFIGFGHVDRAGLKPHASTEIGAYDCSWRIVRGGRVVCGKDDAVDGVEELHERFSRICLGRCVAISQPSELDVRIEFSTDVVVDILCTISDDDEVLHIFFPNKQVLTFQAVEGWRLGRSDEPWPALSPHR
jgi:hypothetical protein